jgi:hypothetical protein
MICVLQNDRHENHGTSTARDIWMTGQPVGYMALSEVNPSPAN